MFQISQNQKTELENLSQKKGLGFMVAFGSQVKGSVNQESDLDIAVLDKQPYGIGRFAEIYGAIQDIFPSREVDLIFLNKNIDSLLKFEILTTGKCLAGDYLMFCAARANIFRDYLDKKDLLELQSLLIRKRQQALSNFINA